MKITLDKKQIIQEMDGAVAGGGFTAAGGATTSSLGVSSNSAATGSEAIASYGGNRKQIKNKKLNR